MSKKIILLMHNLFIDKFEQHCVFGNPNDRGIHKASENLTKIFCLSVCICVCVLGVCVLVCVLQNYSVKERMRIF